MRTSFLYPITLSLLALFAGGCITILLIVVPFWQSLSPSSFLDWFGTFGPTVGMTMLPMEVGPLILSMVCRIYARRLGAPKGLWTIACICNVLIILSFFLYFLPVNLSFLQHRIAKQDLAQELLRWEILHVGRTVLSLVSAGLAIKIVSSSLSGARGGCPQPF